MFECDDGGLSLMVQGQQGKERQRPLEGFQHQCNNLHHLQTYSRQVHKKKLCPYIFPDMPFRASIWVDRF